MHGSSPPIASPAGPLPLSTRMAFGAGDLGQAAAAIIISFFQLFFLTTVAGLTPGLAGLLIMLVKIVDAGSDILVGWLSDRTRSRLGRRRSWLAYGALPFALSFGLLWAVPPFGQAGLFAYYLVVMLVFQFAFTAISVPYTALTPELSDDSHERTTLNAFRFAFSIGGSLLAALAHQAIVGSFCADVQQCARADLHLGYLAGGAVVALVALPSLAWCVLGTRERPRPAHEPPPLPLRAQARAIAANRPYWFVIGIYFCSWLALQVTSAVLPFYITFWLGRPDLIWVFIPLVQASALAWLFVWNAAERVVGKQAVYLLGMTAWVGVQAGLFWVTPGATTLVLVLCVLAGAGVATAYLIPWSMMPDAIEVNELQTGQRFEGIAYGGMVFLQKLGIALALFLVSLTLEWQGFQEAATVGAQPESALLAIRVLVAGVPALALVVGMLLALAYPLNRRARARMMADLAARRAAEAGSAPPAALA